MGRQDRAMLTTTSTRRIALVTGAAQGIGQRTALLLADRAHALVLSDLRACVETKAAIEALGGECVEHVGDLCDEAVIDALAERVGERWGRLDVLVNNAGIALIAPIEKTAAAQLRRVLEVNLVAPFLLCRALSPLLFAARGASVVNVASIAGLAGVADRAAYNASKHGLVGLTRTLAAEWGGRGVRVNAVCPAWVKTPMDDASQGSGMYTDADITERVPMGRFASPDDVARAIAFLADPIASAFINGHALVVDGGWTADASWQSLRLQKR
jgi:NAD(P)-dependent dehydrogenase (short-subunit alcohol dehydrogenase family)